MVSKIVSHVLCMHVLCSSPGAASLLVGARDTDRRFRCCWLLCVTGKEDDKPEVGIVCRGSCIHSLSVIQEERNG